jgi:hypothetical protein
MTAYERGGNPAQEKGLDPMAQAPLTQHEFVDRSSYGTVTPSGRVARPGGTHTFFCVRAGRRESPDKARKGDITVPFSSAFGFLVFGHFVSPRSSNAKHADCSGGATWLERVYWLCLAPTE